MNGDIVLTDPDHPLAREAAELTARLLLHLFEQRCRRQGLPSYDGRRGARTEEGAHGQ